MKTAVNKKGQKVAFALAAAPGSEIYVAGTFNKWNPKRNRLRCNSKSGLFKTALTLTPGRHEYKFIVDGDWCLDANCPHCVPNEIGTMNSVVDVPDARQSKRFADV